VYYGAVRNGLRIWLRRIAGGILALVLVVVLAAVTYVGTVAVRHAQPVTLPAPTGRYPVGRTGFDWTDHHQIDPLAPQSGTYRELSVWLWYPATRSPGPRAAYAPGGWGQLHFPGLPGLGESRFAQVRTHSVQDAPIAAGRFPMVVFEPGMGLAAPQYASVAENLASHGYLVAGVTPTYSANVTVLRGRVVRSNHTGNPPTFTTGDGNRLIRTWAADARFAAGQVARLGVTGRFAGHVDAGRTAYVGHSFGGASSIQACSADPHCRGAADLDGTVYGPVVHTGTHEPLLLLGSDNSCVIGTCRPATADDRASRAATRTLLAASRGQARCHAIGGTKHFNFTDYGAYYLAAPLRAIVPVGSIDGDRALTTTNAYLTAFVDHVVRGTPAALLAHLPCAGS
jgi:dienelactone hydrolase